MSSMATVSRPPSVHAPWRKSFMIPLFFLHLGFALLMCLWGIVLYGVSIYLGTDTGISDYSEKLCIASGILGLVSVGIVIAHIVLFSLFKLTSQIFLYGNVVVVVVSFIQLALGIAGQARAEETLSVDFLSAIFAGVMCFLSLWMTVYAVLVWRRVNSGRTGEMSKPRGGKGLDAQDNGIPLA